MKTIKARNNSGDDWKTPDDFYNKLNEKYHFDFDPCPYQADFNGLSIEWGQRNFINPPYNFKRTGCCGCPFNTELQRQLDVLADLLPSEKKRAEYLWKPVYDEYRRIEYRLRPLGLFD